MRAGRDLLYSLRIFRKSPAFCAAIPLTLTLGIGANIAIFTFPDSLLLLRDLRAESA
jgi:hypothetical protein